MTSVVGEDVHVHGRDQTGATVADPMASGQAALTAHDWAGARRHFETALAVQETPEAWEGLSWATWWLNDADAMFEARRRAYRAYRSAGRSRDAARMATWLGTDSVDFRGESALAEGWLGKARRLLEGGEPCVELGWLCIHEAEKHLFANDIDGASRLGEQARLLGRQFGVVDLETMGLATVGLALTTEGAVEEGMARLSEAAATALAEECTELWSVGWCCCYMIYGCERAHDYDRAAQWCRTVDAWSQRMQCHVLSGSCRAHHAGVLMWHGAWDEAEEELLDSASRLAAMRPPMAVEALVRLGELRRRQGRLSEAADMFDDVAQDPAALLGSGELCLDRGDPPGARDRAEQYLRDTAALAPVGRAAGLELLVRACALTGDSGRAESALDELVAVADRIPTEPLRASASFCRGLVASAGGDHDRARTAFEDAVRGFRRAGAPFEEARARLALAHELVELGRGADALGEGQAAALTFRRLGAVHEVGRADALVRGLRGRPARPVPVLTARECEVLRLVADGRTNRAIAGALGVSEHTVNRHMTNVLTKLQAPSRSAAVAEALRRGLI